MKKIAIIGGGACGAAALIELLILSRAQHLQEQVALVLIERNANVGYGLAFGTRQKSHILNTPAKLMGIYAHEPEHFSEWLTHQKSSYLKTGQQPSSTHTAYTSRMVYGDYVNEQVSLQIDKARKKGIQVEVEHAEAMDIHQQADTRLQISLSNGKQILAHSVLLALGTPKPNSFQEFKENKAYVDFPWPTKTLLSTTKNANHVGILGTSLSAIDAVLSLVDNGHQGKITLFSPDGLLPRVQPDNPIDIDRQYLTLSNVHRLIRKRGDFVRTKDLLWLYQQEVENIAGKKIDWKSVKRKGKNQLALLKNDLQLAQDGGDAFLQVAYALRYDSSRIWQLMSVKEQALFAHWLEREWAVNRHAIPMQNAKRLVQLLEKGQLNIIAGNEKVHYHHKQQQFVITTDLGKTYTVDHLVNATGTATQLTEMNNVLLKNLLRKNYLKPYPMGGACINPHTMQCKSDQDNLRLYAVGHLANGMLKDVNAVWFNVQTIAKLASEIIDKISHHGRL